jgi:hypothetical protein
MGRRRRRCRAAPYRCRPTAEPRDTMPSMFGRSAIPAPVGLRQAASPSAISSCSPPSDSTTWASTVASPAGWSGSGSSRALATATTSSSPPQATSTPRRPGRRRRDQHRHDPGVPTCGVACDGGGSISDGGLRPTPTRSVAARRAAPPVRDASSHRPGGGSSRAMSSSDNDRTMPPGGRAALRRRRDRCQRQRPGLARAVARRAPSWSSSGGGIDALRYRRMGAGTGGSAPSGAERPADAAPICSWVIG